MREHMQRFLPYVHDSERLRFNHGKNKWFAQGFRKSISQNLCNLSRKCKFGAEWLMVHEDEVLFVSKKLNRLFKSFHQGLLSPGMFLIIFLHGETLAVK